MSRDPRPGGKPTLDPKDRVALTEIRKRGEHYEATGYVGGRRVAVEIGADEVEKRSRGDAEALMRRSILGVSQMPRDGDKGT